MIRKLAGEAGYSLVEVMASIMILAIAIIPMVGMFDMGLQTATRGSNYDKARTFANQQLELAKALSYEHVKNTFPTASSTPNPDFSATLTAPTSAGLPPGSTYTVAKRYVSTNAANPSFSDASSDQGLIRITVSVNWSGNRYTTVGLKAR